MHVVRQKNRDRIHIVTVEHVLVVIDLGNNRVGAQLGHHVPLVRDRFGRDITKNRNLRIRMPEKPVHMATRNAATSNQPHTHLFSHTNLPTVFT